MLIRFGRSTIYAFNGRNGLTICLPCNVNCGNIALFGDNSPKNSTNLFTLLKQHHSAGLRFDFCDITPLFDDRLIWAAQSKLIEV